MYAELRSSLLERLGDKESLIRSYSVIALSRLAVVENPDDLEDDDHSITQHLTDSLLYDPAPYVFSVFLDVSEI